MSITLQELRYSPKERRDVLTTAATLDFNPGAYTAAEEAAKALFEALKKVAVEAYGQSPSEVFISAPAETEAAGYGPHWRVCWEAGPYDWAIGASYDMRGPWGHTEPYYGFDLCFYA